MKHLTNPFDQTAKLKITTGSKKILLEAELASSEIEIYQSLNYRQPEEFIQPLVLRFQNPNIQYFSRQSFAFPVIQVCAERKTGLVKRVAPIAAQANTDGNFIQCNSEFLLVLFLPTNAPVLKQIKTGVTTIRF
ncbi:MAG: hypothetical protein IM449_16915 [Microcystis sp. M065S1]|jgi:hypothetical protein|nr:hypothetical protein [Microcystis sp. M065S1]